MVQFDVFLVAVLAENGQNSVRKPDKRETSSTDPVLMSKKPSASMVSYEENAFRRPGAWHVLVCFCFSLFVCPFIYLSNC